MSVRAEGMEFVEVAAGGAARLTLRPILITSLAFILGVLPLDFASGAGASARKLVGISVFSGVIVRHGLPGYSSQPSMLSYNGLRNMVAAAGQRVTGRRKSGL